MIDPTLQDIAIQKFKAIGVKIAIDDLGSGYSNLLRLSSLPFDIIKVDQGLFAEYPYSASPDIQHGQVRAGYGRLIFMNWLSWKVWRMMT
jgi:predicted signal transduction protein with EAL and GGDEF domain